MIQKLPEGYEMVNVPLPKKMNAKAKVLSKATDDRTARKIFQRGIETEINRLWAKHKGDLF